MSVTDVLVQLASTLGFTCVCLVGALFVINKFVRSADKRMADAAKTWLEHESLMADVLDDIGRMRPEVEEMVELNRARLVALQPIVRQIASQKPMTIRKQWRASRDLKRIKRGEKW